jgi:chaperone BCS1
MTSIGNHRGLFSKILDEARVLAMEAHSGKTIMYTVVGVDWRPFGHPRQRRPLNSVVLDEGVGEKLVTDVKEFIQVSFQVINYSYIGKETSLRL